MLAATGGESEGRLGWSGRPEAETAQAAQHMCRRRLARRSRCVENCVVTLGRKRLAGSMGCGGLRKGGTSRQSEVALKESKECVYVFRVIGVGIMIRLKGIPVGLLP